MFYNTGIGTYIWIVTNRKEKRRKGKIQLLDARDIWTPGGSEESKRSLGDKRRHMTAGQIDEIVRLYGRFKDGERSKIFDNADFGYTRVTVERPLRLRYQMTADDKARFLDACPHLLAGCPGHRRRRTGGNPAVTGMWSGTASRIRCTRTARAGKSTDKKLFRAVFTRKDPDAEPVLPSDRARRL